MRRAAWWPWLVAVVVVGGMVHLMHVATVVHEQPCGGRASTLVEKRGGAGGEGDTGTEPDDDDMRAALERMESELLAVVRELDALNDELAGCERERGTAVEEMAASDDAAMRPPAPTPPPTREVVPQARAGGNAYWMVFVMTTVARKGHPQYLLRALDSLLAQLCVGGEGADACGGVWDGRIGVFVHHSHGAGHSTVSRGEGHVVFEQARTEFADHPLVRAGHVRFATSERVAGQGVYPKKLPSASKAIAWQSLDVAQMLSIVNDEMGGTEFVMTFEDDFVLCPNALHALSYFVHKSLRYNPGAAAMRVSYGFNGCVMRTGEVTDGLVRYLVKHHARKPPDLLAFDFLSTYRDPTTGTTGVISSFRSNLFHHIGEVSSLKRKPVDYIPECYQLLYDWLQPAERFDFAKCPNDDVSPCPRGGKHPPPLVDFDVRTKAMCRRHFPLCPSHVTKAKDARANNCRLPSTK